MGCRGLRTRSERPHTNIVVSALATWRHNGSALRYGCRTNQGAILGDLVALSQSSMR